MSLIGKISRSIAGATGNTRLDRLCRESGWSIDVRQGNGIGLHFKGDSVTPRRTVFVIHADGDPLMAFACLSRAEFTARTMPNRLLAGLLEHNEDLALGGWVAVDEDGTISLKLKYTALAAGVDVEMFRLICMFMVKEVADIEAEMHDRSVL
jgi:hypothetical protein